jgi:LPS export ABC transporter protein LptC
MVRYEILVARWRRIMFWAIPGVLLAALAWSLIPHGGHRQAQDGPPPGGSASGRPPAAGSQTPATPAHRAVPGGEIQAGTLVGTDEAGRKRWQIAADDVLLVQGGNEVLLRNVRATFFDPSGSPMRVSGLRGRYNTVTRDVDIEGSVHGVSDRNGRELFADMLHYAPASHMVTGTGHIRVIEKRTIVYADELVSDIALGQTKFIGHVHMTLR